MYMHIYVDQAHGPVVQGTMLVDLWTRLVDPADGPRPLKLLKLFEMLRINWKLLRLL